MVAELLRLMQVRHGLVAPAVAESVQAFLAANQTFQAGGAPAAAPAAAAGPTAKWKAARRAAGITHPHCVYVYLCD